MLPPGRAKLHIAERDRVVIDRDHDDRDRLRRGLRRFERDLLARREQHVDTALYLLLHRGREPLGITVEHREIDRQILPCGRRQLAQPLLERDELGRRAAVDQGDDADPKGLVRRRGDKGRESGCAADNRKQIAPPHSMTSSTRASSRISPIRAPHPLFDPQPIG